MSRDTCTNHFFLFFYFEFPVIFNISACCLLPHRGNYFLPNPSFRKTSGTSEQERTPAFPWGGWNVERIATLKHCPLLRLLGSEHAQEKILGAHHWAHDIGYAQNVSLKTWEYWNVWDDGNNRDRQDQEVCLMRGCLCLLQVEQWLIL